MLKIDASQVICTSKTLGCTSDAASKKPIHASGRAAYHEHAVAAAGDAPRSDLARPGAKTLRPEWPYKIKLAKPPAPPRGEPDAIATGSTQYARKSRPYRTERRRS